MTQTLTQVSFWNPVAFSTSYDALDISTVQWLTEKVDGFFYCSGDVWIPTGKPENTVNGSLGLHPVLDDTGCSCVSTILEIVAYMTVVIPLIMLIAKLALRLTQNFHVVIVKREAPPAGSPSKPSGQAQGEGVLFESKSSGAGAAEDAKVLADSTVHALINKWAERHGFDPKREFQNAIMQIKKDPSSFLNKQDGPFDQFKAQCINAGAQDDSIDLFTAFGWMYNKIQKMIPVLKDKNFGNFCYTPRSLEKEEGFAHHFMSAPTRASFPHEVLSEEDRRILWTMKHAYISRSEQISESIESFVLRVLKAENVIENSTIEEFSFYTYIFPVMPD